MSRSDGGPSTKVVAVDTGGTFTDLLLLDEGRIRRLKLPSTPSDPADAVLQGIAEITGEAAPELVLHGSTVATNALLERRGARVALVTNRGFEDVVEIGRQNRPQLYALVGHRPPPLVDRSDRVGIAGRIGPDGKEIAPLDDGELDELPARLREAEAVGVVLLHSYRNPGHERRVARALEALDVPLSISSELLPEYREYERTSTTVVNAYVAPVMSRYLGRLDRETGAAPVRIMGSNGGSLPVERAAREPVHTVLSGPAGGVVGARAWAERAGFGHVVTLDMGGTSTDVSLCPGELLHTRDFRIAGQPVAIPVLDIHTVGAGGGSLARTDAGGALRVGPRSAGADPGPICYGKGGREVTVTDAHVSLRRLPADAFLGGDRALDRNAVAEPLRALARALGTSPEAAAEGVLAVAESAMERALRVMSVERGYDPADFALVAFGGAGALHAAELAERLGAARAIVPPDPGLLSAYGMLAAPVSRDVSRTVLLSTDDPRTPGRIEERLDEMEHEGVVAMRAEGHPPETLSVRRLVDARYRGQSFELRVPAAGWLEAFHRTHEERYGYARPERPVEAVTLRVAVTAPGPRLETTPVEEARHPPPTEPAWAFVDGTWRESTRTRRDDLRAGHAIEGPATIVEYSATTWVPPAWRVEVDEWGCLHLLRTP